MPATRDLGCSIDELERIIYRGLMCPVPGYVQVAAVPRLFRGAAGFFRGERRAIPGQLQGLVVISALSQLVGKFAYSRFKRHRSFKSIARPGPHTPYGVPGSPVRLGNAAFWRECASAATRDCTVGQAIVQVPTCGGRNPRPESRASKFKLLAQTEPSYDRGLAVPSSGPCEATACGPLL